MRNKTFSFILLTMATVLSGCVGPSISSSSSSETSSSSEIVNPFVARYSVSFYTDGANAVEDIVATEGTSISRPVDPFRTGYDFLGWYEDYGRWETAFDFTTMPARNVVLYAHWIPTGSAAILEYRNQLAATSQANHLYLHYRRFTQTSLDYSQWDAWIWPENGTGRMVDFKKNDDNTVYFDDFGGAVIDLDLTTIYQDGGHDGHGNKTTETVNFMPEGVMAKRIGFLLTFKSSRTGGTHWTSDGGDKFLVTADALAVGPNGSLHVFAVQENVKDFTYRYGGEVYENPYQNDTGTNVSSGYRNVDSSGTPMPIAPTSPDLYDLGVGYQILVASFADSDGDGLGDIRGILEHLDYLEALHIEVLWLTPIQLSDSYHGYDIIDYRKVDPKFGSRVSPHAIDGKVTAKSTMLDYIDLIQETKNRDMKVIMDLVVNHTSINNVLFQESLSLNPDYRAYYHWRNHDNETLNTFWHPYSTYAYSYYGKFASSMPELNYDYQATRDVMVDIMDYWSTLGVGGFRIDAVKHVYMAEEVTPEASDIIIRDGGSSVNYDSNLTKNLHFFRELNARLKEKHPESFIVGENFDGHAYRVAPYYQALDSMLNFYMYYNLMQAAANGDRQPDYRVAANVSGAYIPQGGNNFVPNVQSDPNNIDTKVNVPYGGAWNYPGISTVFDRYRSDDGQLENRAVDGLFTSNHDLVRPVNKVTGTLNASGDFSSRGIVSSANGNHATEMALTTGAAVLLLPGLSWIYYGDELGMSGNLPSGTGESTPNADRFSRQPFKWDQAGTDGANTHYTFTGDKTYEVAWDNYNATLPGAQEQAANATSQLASFQALAELKSTYQAFKTGTYVAQPITQYSSNYNVFAFKRVGNDGTFSVYINMCNDSVSLTGITGEIALSIKNATRSTLPPWSILVTQDA